MAKARKGMLPVQAWDEINVSHDRVKQPQSVEMKPSKEMKQMMREMARQSRSRKRR